MHGSPERGAQVAPSAFRSTGRFGRLFPSLPALTAFQPGPQALGAPGGAMDAASGAKPDNPRIKAGYTFLGQFIDHDITFDPTSILEQEIDVAAIHNFRTPAFELDSVYGQGPDQQPYLYQSDGVRLALSELGDHDLPRFPRPTDDAAARSRALIGDPRNDENLIISQLHLLFLKFHNAVVERLEADGAEARTLFDEARRQVRWHYQWIVMNEFLPRIVGPVIAQAANDWAEGEDFSTEAFMPLEFSVAAYRFGHAQVRGGYRINATFGAALFPADPNAAPGNDLRGFRPVPAGRAVDWSLFFGTDAQPSLRINPRLSTPLLTLPGNVVGSGQASLATRNLQRGLDAGLPAGQRLAQAAATPDGVLREDQIWGQVPGGTGPAPAWFYVLREAEVFGQGLRLGGAGAQIVARTFQTLWRSDPGSQIRQDPHWQPDGRFGGVTGSYSMTDLINFTLGTTIGGEVLGDLPDAAAQVV